MFGFGSSDLSYTIFALRNFFFIGLLVTMDGKRALLISLGLWKNRIRLATFHFKVARSKNLSMRLGGDHALVVTRHRVRLYACTPLGS